jgi:hypothetical protein
MNSGAMSYPAQTVDRMCRALGCGGRDREHMQRLFSRHARGKATQPERTLLCLLSAMVAPVPTELLVSADADTEFEIKVRKRMSNSEDPADAEPACAELVPLSRRVPSEVDDCADEKLWGVGYLMFHKSGSEISPELLERAKSLILAIQGRVGTDKTKALIYAIRSLYADLPQTWAAWDERSDFVARTVPDEMCTFLPEESDQVGPWLCGGIDRQRTVMFLVPLVGFSKPPFCHYHIPDLPAPDDPMMSSEDLLKIIDGGARSDERKSSGS